MQYLVSFTSYVVTKIIWYGDKDICFAENIYFIQVLLKRNIFLIQIPSHIVEHVLKIATERKEVTKKKKKKAYLFFSVCC